MSKMSDKILKKLISHLLLISDDISQRFLVVSGVLDNMTNIFQNFSFSFGRYMCVSNKS